MRKTLKSNNTGLGRGVRAVIMFLLTLSIIETILCILPIANNLYWPAVAVAMELWPFFIIINIVGLVLVRFKSKALTALFAIGLVIAIWPLFYISKVKADVETQWKKEYNNVPGAHSTTALFLKSFTEFAIPQVVPQKLPDGILFYSGGDADINLPKPIVIDIHGGGWHYGSPNDDDIYSCFLADKGYAVFSIPYRFAPQFTFPTQLDDVRKAIKWIHANAGKYGADSTRIVLLGRSAGGNLAMLAGYNSPDIKVSGIISFYPATDMKAMHNHPPSPDPHNVPLTIAEYLGGIPDEVPEKYRQASPVTFVKAGLPPTLQLQGSRDKIQRAQFPRALHQKLLQSGNTSILVELPWSHHSFDFVYFCPGGQLAEYYTEQFLMAVFRRK